MYSTKNFYSVRMVLTMAEFEAEFQDKVFTYDFSCFPHDIYCVYAPRYAR